MKETPKECSKCCGDRKITVKFQVGKDKKECGNPVSHKNKLCKCFSPQTIDKKECECTTKGGTMTNSKD